MHLKIQAVPPFDFHLSATIFATGDPQVRTYANGTFWQVLRVNSKLALVIVTASGTVEQPELSVDLQPRDELSPDDIEQVEATIASLFNIPLDLTAFYQDVQADAVLAALTRRLSGLKGPSTPTVFEALVDSIIEQQIALNVAHRLERTVIKTFGAVLELDAAVYYAYPTPENIAAGTIDQLRACGLSMRKAEYIYGIATAIVDGELDLERFKTCEDAELIIRELTQVRGIGRWTAELTMLRGMHKSEAFPADDLGLRRHIAHYYCDDHKISGAEARAIAENWGRWKGLAAYYLVVADRLGMEREVTNNNTSRSASARGP
ncbi:MAG TPA: DNA-3-methyladenine glycosylase 2 family protein [Methanomicrobia archaeon]|nr:DNA-3-methyladenine glycosylase 2 family protein [Methanomicrobia archaeon]